MNQQKRCRIWWNGVNKEISGVIEDRFAPDTYIVRLDNGKQSIVHKQSIRKWEELSSE